MRLSVTIGTPYLPADERVRLVGLLIRLFDIPSISLPLRLIVVVDKSESMMLPMVTQELLEKLKRQGVIRQAVRDGITVWEYSGARVPELEKAPRGVDFVKEALKQIVERLKDDDEFALIAFATYAQTVIPLRGGRGRREVLERLDIIETLDVGKETRLSAGLQEALMCLTSSPPDGRVSRIVVLTDGFAQDETDCHTVAAQVAEIGASISTLGVSAQFNDELMMSLADETGGNAEWVPDPSQIPEAMRKEFERARKVGAPQTRLTLKLVQGVEVRRAYKIRPILAPIPAQVVAERVVALKVGDLTREGETEILIELLAPPRPEGAFRLATLQAEWRTRTGQQETPPHDVLVTYTKDTEKVKSIDPRVAKAMEAMTAANLQTRALRELERGDIAAATKKLEAAATRLSNIGEHQKARQTLELTMRLQRGERVSPEQTKRLRYQTRRLG